MLSENVHVDKDAKEQGKGSVKSSLCLSWNEAKIAHDNNKNRQTLDMERKSLIRQLPDN